jgi:hypothetical protein
VKEAIRIESSTKLLFPTMSNTIRERSSQLFIQQGSLFLTQEKHQSFFAIELNMGHVSLLDVI